MLMVRSRPFCQLDIRHNWYCMTRLYNEHRWQVITGILWYAFHVQHDLHTALMVHSRPFRSLDIHQNWYCATWLYDERKWEVVTWKSWYGCHVLHDLHGTVMVHSRPFRSFDMHQNWYCAMWLFAEHKWDVLTCESCYACHVRYDLHDTVMVRLRPFLLPGYIPKLVWHDTSAWGREMRGHALYIPEYTFHWHGIYQTVHACMHDKHAIANYMW